MMNRGLLGALLAMSAALCFATPTHSSTPLAFIDGHIAAHPGQTGVYVLDTGAQALVARAWLADNAQHSIEAQYFIWSTDNVGVLAAEALLRAADRGVRVRVIVDAILIDAPDASLLALASHPNIDIRIYNPRTSSALPAHSRLLNVFSDFRGVNQRMHAKTFIVDGKLAITGGRNMAAEYYDYNQAYNFRDRDALLLGKAASDMQQSFEQFWSSELSVAVEQLYRRNASDNLSEAAVNRIYRQLHEYANLRENFAPEVRKAIADTPAVFPVLAKQVHWTDVQFINDRPGKNDGRSGLAGGGLTSSILAGLVQSARTEIVIQSPYLVMSDKAMALFKQAIARGVRVRVSTNSLASTDNIHAFSGYRNQRKRLLGMGVQIFEYKPDPQVQRQLEPRTAHGRRPVFAIHAKTMVIDSSTVYIGTFNFDPRSENLNTETGVVARNEVLARAVKDAIDTDMHPTNSWNAATDEPDQYVSFAKRSKVRFWQMVPLKPLL
jgi:putative cardiolipin synthase